MEGENVHAGLHWGEGRGEGVPEASGDGTDPIDMTKFRKRIGADGAELRREDIQDVLVICIRSKKEHRMIRNFLKGTRGDAINTLMAAAAYNMRHWMNKHVTSLFVSWQLALARRLKNTIFEHENQYACESSRLAIVAG